MVDHPPRKQLSIKIKAQESRSETKLEPPAAAPAPAYVYHWDRIIGALSALLVLLGLIGYGFYSWLSPPVPASSDVRVEAQTRNETVETTAGRASDADDHPMADTLVETVAEPAAEPMQPLEQPTPDMAATPPNAGVSVPMPERDSDSGNVPVVDPAASEQPAVQPDRVAIAGLADVQSPSGKDPVADTAVEAITIPIPRAADPDEPETQESAPRQTVERPSAASASESVGSEPSDQPSDLQMGQGSATSVVAEPESNEDTSAPAPAQTATASPAVVRFQLAQSVVGNEPRGDLDDIRANAKGSALVSSFSEVTGLEGEVLHYRWLHEGKEVLRVRVPVRANRWRSHSEKRIRPGMEGAWRVELLDSKGTVLGTIDFVY